MTPGPTLIYSCPNCKSNFKRRSIGSGNTFGARTRSDGRLYAPMLPFTPSLITCPQCTSTLMNRNLDPVARFRTYFPGSFMAKINGEERSQHELDAEEEERRLAELYEDVPLHGNASSGDYFKFLAKTTHPLKEEISLRKQALWLSNDETYPWTLPNRSRSIKTLETAILRQNQDSKKISPEAIQNIIFLIDNLAEIDEDDLLLKAELLREIERFKESSELLDRELENGAIAEQLLQKADSKNSKPFLLAPSEDAFDWENAWLARRYEPEKIAIPFEDLSPPLFKISNRNWFVKVLGMLCHNWALIEENKDNSATVYFFQDHSPGQRPAVIDSLNFTDEDEAWNALELNGFELLKKSPGPWMGCEPKGFFYDARAKSVGVYSSGKYWIEK